MTEVQKYQGKFIERQRQQKEEAKKEKLFDKVVKSVEVKEKID